ncbi:serine aminopeptidase domain-containing protein [Paraburkholderia phosphatilytica]|uniref:serine aminopeptidase domain-containing protein n=1 Tax=Paraburkholderia phosphatilytica TaxID=2282883 RepID=UPI000E4883B7|nr:alpha/beta hydrolase [Paraburkholderia phosphatilytica]
MEPIVFGECFGWLHAARGSRGVVLCAPFGYDQLCTHRGWRRLAAQLAANGLATLRFDYPGTGDSAGVEEDPGRLAAWLDSISLAIDTLRARTGVTEIALCGFRLGALLAARVAERRGDVHSLALLAPVTSGRLYVRELRAHRQRWLTTPAGFDADPLPENAGYVDAYGFGIHGDDVARLSAIDLARGEINGALRPAQRALILDSIDQGRVKALASRYESLDCRVTTGPFDECDRFLTEALYSETPREAFDTLVQWLADGARKASTHEGDAMRGDRARGEEGAAGGSRVHALAPALRLAASDARETPVSFGVPYQAGNYFGIQCIPDRTDPELPAVLFCNTGASHHTGDGRMFTLFARRLAQQGVVSLRMDLAGLGDSSPLSPEVTLDTIYADASGADVAAGAAWLAQRGHRRIVVIGVCGGAFNGLQAARLHPAIVGCVGVNLQKFVWDGAERQPGAPVFAQSRLYWRSAFSLRKWGEALRGEADALRAARAVTTRSWQSMHRRTRSALARVGLAKLDGNPVQALMHELHEKGVQVRLLYGAFDVGLEELKIHFGPEGRALRRYPGMEVRLLPKLDHALFTRTARENVMRDTEAWLFEVMRETAEEKTERATIAQRARDAALDATYRAPDGGRARVASPAGVPAAAAGSAAQAGGDRRPRVAVPDGLVATLAASDGDGAHGATPAAPVTPEREDAVLLRLSDRRAGRTPQRLH